MLLRTVLLIPRIDDGCRDCTRPGTAEESEEGVVSWGRGVTGKSGGWWTTQEFETPETHTTRETTLWEWWGGTGRTRCMGSLEMSDG